MLKQPVPPRVLTDEELGSVATPTLFLVGEHEVLYDAKAALERLERVAPGFETACVRGAGHDLTLVRADEVTERVLAFLDAESPAGLE